MEVDSTVNSASISEWYKNQTVFITGGSGFIGKALLFKLLQVGCSRVYILIRAKRGQDPESRLSAILQNEIYEAIRNVDADYRSKVFAIAGDTTETNLGISEKDRKLLYDNVTAVFHAAASVKFDDSLGAAVRSNLKSTRDVVELATHMKNLKIFSYISTGYANCEHMMWANGVEEKVYERKMCWQKLIELVENYPEELVNALEKKIVGSSVNTYIFTKHLSEVLIQDYSKRMPMVISRPPVVNPPYIEPYPGWVDNISSPIAIIAGAGKGVLRLYIGTKDAKKSYTPVDFCINSIMVSAWHEALNYQKEIYEPVPVYNQESSPKTTGELAQVCLQLRKILPCANALWHAHFITTNNRYLFNIGFFILHFLPGLLMDTILKILGHQARLLRVYRKLYSALYALLPILNLDDKFVLDNYNKLKTVVPDHEKETYYLDIPTSSELYVPYMLNCSRGFRKFIGDAPETSEKDLIWQKRLEWIDITFRCFIVFLFLWIFPLRMFLIPFYYTFNSVANFIDSI